MSTNEMPNLPRTIALLERMPVRINEVSNMGQGIYLVKFKYFSDKKRTWVSQTAPYQVENQDERLTPSEYAKLIVYIIAISASIEDYMASESEGEGEGEGTYER